jgi:hypothetical protein
MSKSMSELKTGTSNEPFPSSATVFHMPSPASPEGSGKPLESFPSSDRSAVFMARSIWNYLAANPPDQKNR